MTFADNIALIDESSKEISQSNYEELYQAINIETPSLCPIFTS